MNEEARRLMLVDDRRDLVALLTMRFGPLPPDTEAAVLAIDDPDHIDRLILAAANAPDLPLVLSLLGRFAPGGGRP